MGNLPHLIDVDLSVVVDAFVAHPGDLFPGDVGILGM